jgi:hypothetical protein
MLVIASSCGLMRVHAALINPHFFKNGDVSILKFDQTVPLALAPKVRRPTETAPE